MFTATTGTAITRITGIIDITAIAAKNLVRRVWGRALPYVESERGMVRPALFSMLDFYKKFKKQIAIQFGFCHRSRVLRLCRPS